MDLTCFHADRPVYGGNSMLERAAGILCRKMGPDIDIPENVTSMARALRSSGTFGVAKSLDSDGWMVDDATLESLGNASSVLQSAYRELLAEWVAKRNIEPQRAVGDEVEFKYIDRGEKVFGAPDLRKGKIIEVVASEASYLICCQSLGHVQSGLGTTGIFVNYEAVHELCPPAEEFALVAQVEQGGRDAWLDRERSAGAG